ncbi:MAG: TIM-barrel domain-containing protein [Planctomycetota bacterium]
MTADAEQTVILANRRFTCLTPTLVRMEFAPDRCFEDRRSMVAHEPKTPRAFEEVTEIDGPDGHRWTVLKTGKLEIHTRSDDRPFDRVNLELRWTSEGLVQFWRPGDRDYQNLGGTLRSLDRYGGEASRLDGVHPATSESPDPSATNWPAWHQCEINPVYAKLHPDPPANLNRGSWLRLAAAGRNDNSVPHRTFNWYVDARRFSPGLISHSGYFFLNDSTSAVLDADDFPVERDCPGAQDWYFFAYGKHFRQALADWRTLSGPAPLPPHRSLGIMFSRWPAFTEDEVRDMVKRFGEQGYPLSVIILDMEWHKHGWGHWEFNPDLLPDPAGFFERCHQAGLSVVLNDHPLDVRSDDCHYEDYLARAGEDVFVRDITYNKKTLPAAKIDITDKRQNRAFVDVCHRPIVDQGMDFWWNDGSRGQMGGTCGQLVANKTFFEEIEQRGQRGMLLARHGGLGSHRYGGFFTGDTAGDWHMLTTQVEFNVRGAHIGLSWMSHDIGGFMARGKIDENRINPELYLRWLQFGVFNPLLRFHCAPNAGSRLPYDYDDDVDGACRYWLRQRHALLPYLYTAGRTAYDTGLPVARGCFIDYPDDEKAYRFDQYMFGPDLLVAPVTAARRFKRFYLPGGLWYDRATGRRVAGGVEIGRDVPPAEVPVYVRAGSVIPTQDPDRPPHAPHVDPLVLEVYPPAEDRTGGGELYEDDGRSNDYQADGCCRTRFTLETDASALTLRGEVEQGSPLGKTRHVVVRVAVPSRPAGVELDGSALPDDAVEPEPTGLRVTLGELGADRAFELRLTW